jgi:hypothetical protein
MKTLERLHGRYNAERWNDERYWPHLELVGTFHSHPYEDLSTVKDLKGWRATAADLRHWEWIHENLSSELPSMANIIVTITELKSKGWAFPSSLEGGEALTGFVFTSDYRKFWIKGYSSEATFTDLVDDENEEDMATYKSSTDILLDIPSLLKRFF